MLRQAEYFMTAAAKSQTIPYKNSCRTKSKTLVDCFVHAIYESFRRRCGQNRFRSRLQVSRPFACRSSYDYNKIRFFCRDRLLNASFPPVLSAPSFVTLTAAPESPTDAQFCWSPQNHLATEQEGRSSLSCIGSIVHRAGLPTPLYERFYLSQSCRASLLSCRRVADVHNGRNPHHHSPKYLYVQYGTAEYFTYSTSAPATAPTMLASLLC